MERRFALKQLALLTGVAITLPSWATSWSSESLPKVNGVLSSSEEDTLGEIVDTLIPKTDTLGAKQVGVHQFINLMLTDCYEREQQEAFSKGIKAIDDESRSKFKKSFATISGDQKKALLQTIESEQSIQEYAQIKMATVYGYLNSEYVMKEILKYELVPGRFDGCFPVNK